MTMLKVSAIFKYVVKGVYQDPKLQVVVLQMFYLNI